MSLKTEFNVIPFVITPSRKLDMNPLPCVNYQLHACLITLSSLMVSNIKSPSNNMSSAIVPRDVANFHVGWAVFKAAYKFALAHNDPPNGSLEKSYIMLVPSQNELMGMPNSKFKAINQQIYRLCTIVVSTDAAKVGGNIDVASAKMINDQIVICEEAILFWVGKGKDNSDVGISVPLFSHVGEVVPDYDYDNSINEPSPARPNVGMPDVPDIINNGK